VVPESLDDTYQRLRRALAKRATGS
jgi:hypothetical protein